MRKKGDISINMIVIAALALIVLVVIVFIFSGQVKKTAGGFAFIGNDAAGGVKGTKCETVLGGRICSTSSNYNDIYNKYEL